MKRTMQQNPERKLRAPQMTILGGLTALAFASATWASDARTSASATGGSFRPGTASASAKYEGDVGFARTQTRSGAVNAARAVSLGVDEDGLSFSISTAIASPRGPALAANFNFSIATNGEAAHSLGTTVSKGGATRTAAAAGNASTSWRGATAASLASGKTSYGGLVKTQTRSYHQPRPVLVRHCVRLP